MTFWANGLTKYNRKTEDFTNYLPNINNKYSPAFSSIFSISIDNKNNVWSVLSDEPFIQKFDVKTNRFIKYIPSKEFKDYYYGNNNVVADKNNGLWISNLNAGVLYFNTITNQFTAISHNSQNPESFSESRAGGGLYIDYDNNIWISSLNKGINTLNLTFLKNKYYEIKNNKIKVTSGIRHFLEDSNGNYWVCSEEGVFFYDKQSQKYTKINLPNTEKFYRLVNLFDGSILANSESNIYKINTQTLIAQKHNLIIKDLKISTVVNSFKDSKNRLWLFTDNYLYIFDTDKCTKIALCEGCLLEKYHYINFFEYNENFYFSIESKLYAVNIEEGSKNEIKYEIKNNNERITSIHLTKDSIYINYINGYFAGDKNLTNFVEHSYEFLSNSEVVPMCYFYNDTMQCLTTYRGVYIYNIKNQKIHTS